MKHDFRFGDYFMREVDDLFHEVGYRLVACNSTTDQHAIAGLRLQLMLKSSEAGFG